MTWTTLAMIKCGRIKFGTDVIVSYLPLSHAAGQLIDLCVPVCSGATVYFAQPDALKVIPIHIRNTRNYNFSQKYHNHSFLLGKAKNNDDDDDDNDDDDNDDDNDDDDNEDDDNDDDDNDCVERCRECI